jgi:hypothetical protein
MLTNKAGMNRTKICKRKNGPKARNVISATGTNQTTIAPPTMAVTGLIRGTRLQFITTSDNTPNKNMTID